MDAAVLLARLVLAAVFGLAALAKLGDRAGSRQAIIDFGVPPRLATPLGIALPLGELTVAVALLSPGAARQGALGAFVLLLLFTVGIGINLVRGRRPDCHCFGQLHARPLSETTLVRNALLAAVAGFVAWQVPGTGGGSVVGWLGNLDGFQLGVLLAGIILAGLVLGEGWLLMSLFRQHGRVLLRLDALEAALVEEGVIGPLHPQSGLPVGSPAPAFDLAGLDGSRHTLESLLSAGRPVVLVFTDPDCGPCRALLPEIAGWQRDHGGQLTIVLLSQGSVEHNRAEFSRLGVERVLLQKAEGEIADAYRETATPAAVLVRPDGTIGSPVAAGRDEVRQLVTRVLEKTPVAWASNRRRPVASPPAVGQPAPAFELPDLGGGRITLEDLRGSKTVVLFWNASCRFCQEMLADLKAWEARRKDSDPALLIVSNGTVEENRAMGLHSTVVLDDDLEVAASFGASGTPMAVLIDPDGRIASELAEGAPKVLRLCGGGVRGPAAIRS